jgi:hypothetical protein
MVCSALCDVPMPASVTEMLYQPDDAQSLFDFIEGLSRDDAPAEDEDISMQALDCASDAADSTANRQRIHRNAATAQFALGQEAAPDPADALARHRESNRRAQARYRIRMKVH